MTSTNFKKPRKLLLLDVDGMKCAGCVGSVEKILNNQKGVLKASVNLVSRTAYVDLNDENASIEPILEALIDRGFPSKVKIQPGGDWDTQKELKAKSAWWQQWRQLVTSLTLLLISVIGHLAQNGKYTVPLVGELSFHAVIATYALLGPGRQILQRGFKAASNLSPNMDTLVGLGVTSAYLASLVALFWPNVGWPCFFNEPVMLLGFVLLGRFLEERARIRTGLAIQELAKLLPETARLYSSNNEIREVRVGALRPGEKVQLLAGDRIPVDGRVIEGKSAVDVSSLNGEPLPIEASPGTELKAGSLNLESNLIIEVENVGSETVLARIIGLVEEAQGRKAPIQGIADKVAGFFCYGVVTLSIATFVFWWKLGSNIWPEVLNASGQGFLVEHGVHAHLGAGASTSLGLAIQLSIAVLVIACPCALGLATPTVITVASGQSAKQGWLFRGGDIIEKASNIKEIIFDKTGTLTIGKPSVTSLKATDDPNKLIQIAASLESNSRHPLAIAIIDEASKKGISLLKSKDVRTFPGEGIIGFIEGIEEPVRAGTTKWLQKEGIEFNKSQKKEIKSLISQGESLVAVSISNSLKGIISIDDKIRDNLLPSLNRLRENGYKLNIYSGDRSSAVQKLGATLGFEAKELNWELLPEQKLQKLEFLKRNSTVAMVGDGINDAPALAAADIGIAVGTGTQIAQESADLILLGDRLEALPEALALAEKTMNKVKQNLTWAFGYNLIALPIAAGILLPKYGLLLSPPIAAFLMAISSITVVLNALSLRSS